MTQCAPSMCLMTDSARNAFTSSGVGRLRCYALPAFCAARDIGVVLGAADAPVPPLLHIRILTRRRRRWRSRCSEITLKPYARLLAVLRVRDGGRTPIAPAGSPVTAPVTRPVCGTPIRAPIAAPISTPEPKAAVVMPAVMAVMTTMPTTGSSTSATASSACRSRVGHSHQRERDRGCYCERLNRCHTFSYAMYDA